MSQLHGGWAVSGIDLPEAFDFPITKLTVGSLDCAIFDSSEAAQLRVEAERYWETRGVDIESIFGAEGAT